MEASCLVSFFTFYFLELIVLPRGCKYNNWQFSFLCIFCIDVKMMSIVTQNWRRSICKKINQVFWRHVIEGGINFL